MVNVSGSRSAVADAQRDMPRETQLDEEKIGMEEGVRIEAKHDYSPIEAEAIEDRLCEYNRGAAGAHDGRTLGHMRRAWFIRKNPKLFFKGETHVRILTSV